VLTPAECAELVLCCKFGVACLAWLTFVVTARWLQERKRPAPAVVVGSDDV
jgi:hypothetical protein